MVNTSLSAAERSPTNSQNSAVAVRGPSRTHFFSTPLSSVNDRIVFLALPPESARSPAASSSILHGRAPGAVRGLRAHQEAHGTHRVIDELRVCTAHGRVDRRRHPIPVALVRGAFSPSRIAADPHPGARLLRGGDHPHDLGQQRGVDGIGHPPRNRRAVQVLARVPQNRGVEWTEYCSALGATAVRVVLLSSFPVGRLCRRAHRRADLTALEQIDVGPMGDEPAPVPPDALEERVDVRGRGRGGSGPGARRQRSRRAGPGFRRRRTAEGPHSTAAGVWPGPPGSPQDGLRRSGT